MTIEETPVGKVAPPGQSTRYARIFIVFTKTVLLLNLYSYLYLIFTHIFTSYLYLYLYHNLYLSYLVITGSAQSYATTGKHCFTVVRGSRALFGTVTFPVNPCGFGSISMTPDCEIKNGLKARVIFIIYA